jgi:hypothetical protein
LGCARSRLLHHHGRRCSATYLNILWNDWRDSQEVEPLRGLKITIHGLRATKINDLRCAGTEDGAIADEIGMSPKMVARYLRFADKTASGRASSPTPPVLSSTMEGRSTGQSCRSGPAFGRLQHPWSSRHTEFVGDSWAPPRSVTSTSHPARARIHRCERAGQAGGCRRLRHSRQPWNAIKSTLLRGAPGKARNTAMPLPDAGP